MLVSNTFENDARVDRCAQALSQLGLEVTLLARHREGLPLRERVNDYEVIRLTPQSVIQKSYSPAPASAPAEARQARSLPRRALGMAISRTRKGLRFVVRGIAKTGRSVLPLQKVFGELEFRRRQILSYAYSQAVLDFAKSFKPDLIHAHDFYCLLAAHRVHETLGVPYVYDSHELWTERNRLHASGSKEKNWELKNEAIGLRSALFSITVCDSISEYLARHYQVPKPVVIRNTPERAIPHPEGKIDLRKQLGLSTNDFLAVYVGKLTYHRGVLDILQVLPLMEEKIKLICIGPSDSRFEKEFRSWVKKLKLEKRVFVLPAVEPKDVFRWIASCDVSLTTMNRCCLSYTFALPNKLFESLQAELPIIGPDSPEIERILKQYSCGESYRDGDAKHLAEKILSFQQNPGKVERYRNAASEAARDLCWENEREKLWQAYRQVLPRIKSQNEQPAVASSG